MITTTRPFASRIAGLALLASAIGAGTAPATAAAAATDDLAGTIRADLPGLLDIYRDLHRHPELSLQERRSAAILADAARKAGFEVTEKVGGTGVVAVLRNGPGPTVLIRADMDGLPVIEQTGLPFASTDRGVSTAGVESGIMHACGHDTHMTAWIETARLLDSHRKAWSGTVVMIGQPAEEINEGAKAMLADGLLTRFPKPDYAIAFHDTASLPSGTIGLRAGFALANVDMVDVTVRGVGGHGAYPQLTRDPIVLASAIVMRLQTLVSRESSPFDPSVVTVGAFHAGAKHNIISDEAQLQLTVRSYSDASRKLLLDGIRRIVRAEAEASAIPADRMPTVTVREPHGSATWNTPELTTRMGAVLRARFGEARVREVGPEMAGEDFGEIARTDPQHIQSLLIWVGGRPAEVIDAAAKEGRLLPGLHSPFWAPEADKVIAAAAEALTAETIALLPKR